MSDLPILLDAGSSGPDGYTSTSDWIRCPQLAINKAAGVPGATDRDPLVKGSLIHVALAHHYARQQAPQVDLDPDRYLTPHAAVEALAQKWAREGISVDPEFVPLVHATYDAYAAHYAFERFRLLSVERKVTEEIRGPLNGRMHRWTARIDLEIEDASGRVFIIDHKSYGTTGKRKKEGFELAGQVVGLTWWGRRTYGEQFGGVVINGLQWPKGPTKRYPEGLPPQFERFRPRPAIYAVSKWPVSLEHHREYQEWLRDRYGDDPNNYPQMLQEQGPCMDRYGACPFREACRLGPHNVGWTP